MADADDERQGAAHPDTRGPSMRAGLRRPSRARLVDVIVVLVVAGLGMAARSRPESSPFANWADPWSFLLFAGTTAALLVRRSAPVAVWAVTLVAAAADIVISGAPSLVILTVLIAQFTVATHERARTAVWTSAITAIVIVAAGLGIPRWLTAGVYGIVGWTGMATAIGIAVRNQRAVLAAAHERALRAEQTREEEAQRRVAEERVRIARELHDVVAHHIAVISVQAGVARHLMGTRPNEASEAIGVVRESSQVVMTELGAILGLLRTTEDAVAVQPAPGLDHLDEIVASARHAGLDVAIAVTGNPRPLSPLVDLTGFRIVQESLTNAHKHGAGTANVTVERGPSSLVIDVSNATRTDATAPGSVGLGLLGMRERVAAVGGTLSAGPTGDGRFLVHAELPLRPA
jgi:signal transduction histidine kinase